MSRYHPVSRIIDDNGSPVVNANIYFYEVGTTTEIPIYTDDLFTVPQAQPVLTLTGGVVPEVFFEGVCKVVIKDDTGVQIGLTREPVGEIDAGQFDTWLTDKSYSFNDVVKGSDLLFYRSIVAGIGTNQGNDPTSSPLSWVEFYTDLELEAPVLESPVINTGISGTAVLDDDTMVTATDTTLATSESIKAYIDAHGLIQTIGSEFGTYTSTAAVILADNTVPLITEGAILMTSSITPKSTTSTIEICFSGIFDNDNSGHTVLTVEDVTAGTILYATANRNAATVANPTPISFTMATSSPGLTLNQYRIRWGASSGTSYVNGNVSAGLFSTAAKCILLIREVQY